MKKIICLALILMLLLTACGNRQTIDTTYTFDYAIISLPNGQTIEGKVTGWCDYSDSDAIQVKINGVTYYTFLSNVILMAGR